MRCLMVKLFVFAFLISNLFVISVADTKNMQISLHNGESLITQTMATVELNQKAKDNLQG